MPVTDSPLRYPGGKTQLKGFVYDLLTVNGIDNGTYAEPFAGGAGIAISLLYSNKVKNIIINDLDRSIYYFWMSIIYRTNEFIDLIKSTPITMEEWYRQQEIQRNPENYSDLEIGFSTFFLNRTNVSGIISGGPIGGHEQNGINKLDCRFNKTNLIKKIERIASYRNRIMVTNLDAINFIKDVVPELNKDKTLIFFDPPYYQQGKNLYTNFYNHQDHVNLSNHIKSLHDYYWITTYDFTEEIMKIYNIKNTKVFTINYTANNKRKATELLFYSERIQLPDSDHIKFITSESE